MMEILLTPHLLAVLHELSTKFSVELGGWLTGKLKDGNIILEDLLMPEQSVSGSSLIMTPTDMVNLRRKYKDKCIQIIGHAHSHCNMGCFWSTIDHDNMDKIMEQRKIFVFLVCSRGRNLIRVCVRDPVSLNLEEQSYVISSPPIDRMKRFIDKKILGPEERDDEQEEPEDLRRPQLPEDDIDQDDNNNNNDGEQPYVG